MLPKVWHLGLLQAHQMLPPILQIVGQLVASLLRTIDLILLGIPDRRLRQPPLHFLLDGRIRAICCQ